MIDVMGPDARDVHGHQKQNVAVIGGAGYIGSVLTETLLQAGYRVRVLDRCFFGREPLAKCETFGDRFELVNVDTRLVEAHDFESIDMVVDLAGLSNDPSCALDDGLTQSINVDGGTAVLEAAQRAGVRRFIYQSSCSVYGSATDDVLDEEALLAPVSDYSRSKVEMEERVLKAQAPDFDVVISRPGTVFGLSPRMRFDLLVNTMSLAAVKSRVVTVHGGGQQWRPLIHVNDVARALQIMLEAPAGAISGRIFNVGDDNHNYRVVDIARLVSDLVEGTKVVVQRESSDPRDYRCVFDRVRDELGFRASFEPVAGAREIIDSVIASRVDTGIRTLTVDYYRHLLDSSRDGFGLAHPRR